MERIKNTSLWIFFGLLAYMPLHIFLSTWLGTSFGVLEFAKVFKDIVLVLGFLLALIVSIRKPWFKDLLQDKLVWLIGAYALLTIVIALIKPTDPDAEVLAIVYNLRFFLFFLYGVLLAHLFNPGWLREKALKIVLCVALFVLAFGVIQYVLLPDTALTHVGYSRDNGVLPAFFIDDKPDLERIMSTLRDPNSFGSYAVVTLSFALAYLLWTKNREIKKITIGFLILSILCLWFTFSRAAWIGAVVSGAAAALLVLKQKKNFRISKNIMFVGCALLVIAAAGLFVARNTYLVKNVVFHADESTVLEDPNELRLRFWQESIESATKEPFGYGPGTAGLASIRNDQDTVLNENYYFQILHEVGVLGFLLFVAILVVIAKRLYETSKNNPTAIALLASFVGLAVTNFLAHIWSNEVVAYTWWGLAGILLFSRKERA